jgi:hypothetical protein
MRTVLGPALVAVVIAMLATGCVGSADVRTCTPTRVTGAGLEIGSCSGNVDASGPSDRRGGYSPSGEADVCTARAGSGYCTQWDNSAALAAHRGLERDLARENAESERDWYYPNSPAVP